MEIHTFTFGLLETNCYVVCTDTACFIVDPVSDAKKDIELIKDTIGERKLLFILYTHNHFDHIGGGHRFEVPQYMHEKDIKSLPLQKAGALIYIKKNITLPKVSRMPERIVFGEHEIKILHTPGHSAGSVCFYIEEEKMLLSGDTLFAGTYGRTDLPFASMSEMTSSLRNLLRLPDETAVYPGHGLKTTIGRERGWMEKL